MTRFEPCDAENGSIFGQPTTCTMPDVSEIIEWYKGTRLRPYLACIIDPGKRHELLERIRCKAESVVATVEAGTCAGGSTSFQGRRDLPDWHLHGFTYTMENRAQAGCVCHSTAPHDCTRAIRIEHNSISYSSGFDRAEVFGQP
jgi:hypothetical protein